MADLTQLSASALARMIAAREVGIAELMAATLEGIAAENPAHNALVSLADGDALMAQARAAENTAPKGPLHGLPLAVKDLANAEGFATSMGSPLFAGQVAARDDVHVARLRAAGAIVVGKSNVPEFGLGSHTTNPVFGPAGNAFDPGLTAGGSSGGAAVALARGMVPLADGSDMMGSLRNPAGWNGVYGLRPGWGLVPSEPLGEIFLNQLATNGPMGRCPADLALMLSVICGADPRQPHGVPARAFAPPGPTPPLRIGWLADWGGALAMEAGVLDLCEGALARIEEMGHGVEPLAPPFSRAALWQSWTDLRSWEVTSALGPLHADPAKRNQLKPAAIWEVERGLGMSAGDVTRAGHIRSDWFRAATGLFEQIDVLALPSAQMFPFDKGIDWPREVAGQQMDTYHRWMEVVIAASLIGLPALAIPISGGARPMGLQLIGPRGSEERLLALAEGWHRDIWSS